MAIRKFREQPGEYSLKRNSRRQGKGECVAYGSHLSWQEVGRMASRTRPTIPCSFRRTKGSSEYGPHGGPLANTLFGL
ncbi:unnamed protein product [Dibothriocephalus latus]|uniref:Uncharacterized protein n=1 Tax=Dibothriocephalus latus TaxID=60516 RepID=A0A3P7NVA8_DIBLA|nr:unnamed protein product [Dibothriocephalus latus]